MISGGVMHLQNWHFNFFCQKFANYFVNFANFGRAGSRLYRNHIFQLHVHTYAFYNVFQVLHELHTFASFASVSQNPYP